MAEPSLPHLYSGKVRDIYDAGDDRLLLVTSDRLSAFDVVLAEPIPDKGRVLTAMSAFWFEQLRRPGPRPPDRHRPGRDRRPRHRRRRSRPRRSGHAVPQGRDAARSSASCAATSPARRGRSTRPPAPCTARALPAGLLESAQLPEPVFTPSTKADVGDHDDEHQLRGGGRPDRHRAGRAGPRRVARHLPGGRRLGRRARASSSPTPSSSSA